MFLAWQEGVWVPMVWAKGPCSVLGLPASPLSHPVNTDPMCEDHVCPLDPLKGIRAW